MVDAGVGSVSAGLEKEFSISVALPSSSTKKSQSGASVYRPATSQVTRVHRPRLATVNMNSMIEISGGAPKARDNVDKETAKSSLHLKLNLNQQKARGNESNWVGGGKSDRADFTVEEDFGKGGSVGGSVPTSPAAWEFPGRKSPYIQHYRHAWDLQLARALQREPTTSRTETKGSRSSIAFRPIRRAQSAPVVSQKMANVGVASETQSISTITITGESLLNTQRNARTKRSTSAFSRPPRKLGEVGAMQGYHTAYNSYPKSHTKMMEIVKTLREERRPKTSPPIRRGYTGSGALLDLKVRGNAPGKFDPVHAWGPAAAASELPVKGGITKYEPTAGSNADSEEDVGITDHAPSLTVHIAKGLRDVQDATQTKLLLNRDELGEGESCHAQDYDKGASQLLQYYIARESVEQCAEAQGKAPTHGRHSDCLRSPRAVVRLPQQPPAAPISTPSSRSHIRRTASPPGPDDPTPVSTPQSPTSRGRSCMEQESVRSASPAKSLSDTTGSPRPKEQQPQHQSSCGFLKFNRPVYLHRRVASAPVINSPGMTSPVGNQESSRGSRRKPLSGLARPFLSASYSSTPDTDVTGFVMVGKSMDIEGGGDSNNAARYNQNQKSSVAINTSGV